MDEIDLLLKAVLNPEQNNIEELIKLAERKNAYIVDSLIQALSDTNPGVRKKAVWALREIGDESAIQPLIECLEDHNNEVRWAAVHVLAYLRAEPAIEPIIQKLSDPDEMVRLVTIMALEQLKDARAVEALIPLVNNILVIDALVAINDSRAVEPLIGLLQHDNVGIRTRTAEALGDFRDERAVDALIQSLNDWGNQGLRVSFSKDPGIAAFPCVCHYAAQALLKIGTQKAVESVQQWRAAHPNAGELPT